MLMILAVSIILLAVCVITLQVRNNRLHHEVIAQKAYNTSVLREARKWEGKYWAVRTDLEDTAQTLDRAEEGECSPPSHNVEDVDVEAVMAGSDDPIWDIVIDCRNAGVMKDWLFRHPEIRAQLPHRWYGEFATYILQLPEHQQSVHGVALAVRGE